MSISQPIDPEKDFPYDWTCEDINFRRYSTLNSRVTVGKLKSGPPGRLTTHAIQRRKLRHDLHSIASIKWGETTETKMREQQENEPWESVRQKMHYEVDDSERGYNYVIEAVKEQFNRRVEVEEKLAEETAELNELQHQKGILVADIETSESTQKVFLRDLKKKSKELEAEEAIVEELALELAKAQELKAGLHARLQELDDQDECRARLKSEKAKADKEINDHRDVIPHQESDLADLQDKLASELARAKDLRDHYDTEVAKLEQDVADRQAEFDLAFSAKTEAVNAFAQEREKWAKSHRENRAIERKLAEEQKTLAQQSEELDVRISESHRKSRLPAVGSQRSTLIPVRESVPGP